ncbi:class I SAM-dependent methyltransferase [Rhizobium sp. IBUN]|uniref:class I SAM-dependent methyltransferase n=1 Tax=Rhizobium sp. IBUN TaxID=1042326 RepID=UPI0004042984|nr:class I SAM-dependent methyltransferase [Rhizobium sp. IBUN]
MRDSLVRIKSSLFPRLVFDRTSLDKHIEALTEANSEIAKERDSLLLELNSLRSMKGGNTFLFEGYDIPIDLMQLTGGGPDTFETISRQHTENLRRWIGLEPQHTLLEIGCGIGRDAIPLSKILTAGRYIGIDIIGRSIEWCKSHISAHNPNFQFYHFDVDDQLHNATGKTATTDIRLPADDQSVDRIILFSVFTHMLREDIEHYLREFRRVLKPGGLVYGTTFIFDDAILASARATNLTIFDLRFEHPLEEGCRINDPVHPLGAVAFTKGAWDGMIERSGLTYAKPNLKGAWSGFYSDAEDGQDVVILTRGD